LLRVEVRLDHRRHLELAFEPLAFEGLLCQSHVLHGDCDLDREELEQTHVVGCKGFGTCASLFVAGNQNTECAGVGLQGKRNEVVGVNPLTPGGLYIFVLEAGRSKTADDRGGLWRITEIKVCRTDPEEGNEVADQLLGQGLRVENAADAGGDGTNGLELPKMEALVKTAAFELLPELPCAKANPGCVESQFVEPIQMEEPQAPLSLVPAKRNLAPAFGGLLDLCGNGTRPPGDGLIALFQNPGSRSGLLDHHPEDFLGKVGAGVAAERDIRQAQ
jgi:hypothetical protein